MGTYSIPSPKDQYIPQMENAFKSVLLPGLLLCSFFLSNRLAFLADDAVADVVLKGLGLLLLAIFNGVMVLGMAVLAHDAVHKVLFRNEALNDFVGGVLSALGLIPFYANRQFHLTHHRYAHQPELDPEHDMHSKGWLFAFFIGPHIGIYKQHRLFMLNALTKMHDAKFRPRVLKDSIFLAIAAAFYFVMVPALGLSIVYTFVLTFLVFPFVFSYRAMSDHYGIPEVKPMSKLREEVLEDSAEEWERIRKNKRIQVSGWIVKTNPLLEWFWSHVNYHEVHHKYPYLSHYHLPEVYENTKEEQPYMVVEGYGRNLVNLWGQKYYPADTGTSSASTLE